MVYCFTQVSANCLHVFANLAPQFIFAHEILTDEYNLSFSRLQNVIKTKLPLRKQNDEVRAGNSAIVKRQTDNSAKIYERFYCEHRNVYNSIGVYEHRCLQGITHRRHGFAGVTRIYSFACGYLNDDSTKAEMLKRLLRKERILLLFY